MDNAARGLFVVAWTGRSECGTVGVPKTVHIYAFGNCSQVRVVRKFDVLDPLSGNADSLLVHRYQPRGL